MIQFNEVTLKTFLNDYWQKRPLVIRNALPGFQSPITAEELAGLSLEEEVESRLVIQKSADDYQLLKGPFDEQTYAELPEQDWTLLVQGMDRLIPEVTSLLDEFDFLPRWRIDDIMVSYAVAGGNVGPHYDHYDVFLLQASGKRRWHLTGQDCTEANAIQGLDLRLMQTFSIEESFDFEAGDILYIPPKWGHHGIALDNDCMTYSIGYRSYRGQELWDSFGDHLSETNGFQTLYKDPIWPVNLNPGEISDEAVTQAHQLLKTALAEPNLLKNWFGRFATQLDPGSAQQLPDPLTEAETPSAKEFAEALQSIRGFEKDPVCRFAYTFVDQTLVLYINGAIWDQQGATETFIQALCNQQTLVPDDWQNTDNHALLFDLWKLQYWVFSEQPE